MVKPQFGRMVYVLLGFCIFTQERVGQRSVGISQGILRVEAYGLVVVLAYANRAFAYTLLGKDKEAQQDVDQAVRLGFDRSMLDGAIEGLKKQRKQ